MWSKKLFAQAQSWWLEEAPTSSLLRHDKKKYRPAIKKRNENGNVY